MTVSASLHQSSAINIRWPGDLTSRFPLIWLRDNDPQNFHPETKERIFDLLSVPAGISATSVDITGDNLEIAWTDPSQGISRFSLDWLHAHRPGTATKDAADIPPKIWRAELGAENLPRFRADEILTSDKTLFDWLCATRVYGISIVTDVEDSIEAGLQIPKHIGFLRETNFGVTFEVKTKPNPNNLAYTALALPLHTDLPNQELPPGIQFLHCLANEAEGGNSVFADGFAIAEDLRASAPQHFEILTKTPMPFRFHDNENDIRSWHTIIQTDHQGNVTGVSQSSHLRDVIDLEPDQIPQFYAAYRAFLEKMEDPAYHVYFKLSAGEIAVFDNRRALHGRDSFDPNTGFRHLHGTYVDRGEFESRIRVLARNLG